MCSASKHPFVESRPDMAGASAAAGAQPLQLLRSMLRIRRFEEKCVELYSAQKIRGFLHLYIGEEAVATGSWST